MFWLVAIPLVAILPGMLVIGLIVKAVRQIIGGVFSRNHSAASL